MSLAGLTSPVLTRSSHDHPEKQKGPLVYRTKVFNIFCLTEETRILMLYPTRPYLKLTSIVLTQPLAVLFNRVIILIILNRIVCSTFGQTRNNECQKSSPDKRRCHRNFNSSILSKTVIAGEIECILLYFVENNSYIFDLVVQTSPQQEVSFLRPFSNKNLTGSHLSARIPMATTPCITTHSDAYQDLILVLGSLQKRKDL